MLLKTVVAELPVPDSEVLELARRMTGERDMHAQLVARLPALSAIERHDPPQAAIATKAATVCAWNAERLKHRAPSSDLMAGVDADILLLTEIDVGMARSGNRHCFRDLAQDLGLGGVYCVEFVELEHGNPAERAQHGGDVNSVGFHGNGILSRYPLKDAFVVKLDDGGVWYGLSSEQRVGSRNAIAACVEHGDTAVWYVSVHLESKTDPADRARQTARLLRVLEQEIGDAPCIVGGDFNTNALPRDPLMLAKVFDQIGKIEPLFEHMEAAGFNWRDANSSQPTCRPHDREKPPVRLDWLFHRGVSVSPPGLHAAFSPEGLELSDHDAVSMRAELLARDQR